MTRPTWPAAGVALVSWAIVLFWGILLDDQFGRITLGYQWLTYGDTPFRDFFDPGLFGAATWSAVALWLSGGSLVAEMALDAAAIAIGLGLTCALAARAAGATIVGVYCAALTLAAGPRLYDYDKVLLYPLGLWACWRYADQPSSRRAIVIGAIIALGSILRYDTALYLAAAWLATLVAVHGRSGALFRRAATSLAAVSILLVPVVLWLHWIVGLPEVLDQIATYARIERERTLLFEWSAVLRGGVVPAWNAVMSRGAAAGSLYFGLLLLALLGVALAFSSNVNTVPGEGRRLHRPHVLAVAVLSGTLVLFLLRDPLYARFGGLLPVASVLAAYVTGLWWRSPGGHNSRWRSAVIVTCGVAVFTLVLQGGEINRFERLWLGGPLQVARVGRAQARMLTEVPPALGIMPGGVIMRSLAWYLRQCPPPGRPVMATWFAPHVYYFAQRPFAGGMWAFFGAHWTRHDRQIQIVDRLKARPPSIVIVDRIRYGDFEQNYSLVAEHLLQTYERAGSTSFERNTPATYDVLVPRGSEWKSRDPVWGLVCDSR